MPENEHYLRLLSVSWPRPVRCENSRWISQPDWDAPLMPHLPEWGLGAFEGKGYHTLNWGNEFRCDLNTDGQPTIAEMRGFHVVFRLRVQHSGTLNFFDTDGSIIRCNGEIIHEDREAHSLRQHSVRVGPGDRLDVAHWQSKGEWVWGARRDIEPPTLQLAVAVTERYRKLINEALTRPNGPTLKVYTSAASPLRSALSIYSMILNGYRPAGIQVFGDYQWTPWQKEAMETLLPFADIVSVERVESTLHALDARLVPLARRLWSAMKTCIGLFFPPTAYCFLDDDIFVLDRIDDALALYKDNDLIYGPDQNCDERYRAAWCPDRMKPLPAGDINTGFYLVNNKGDAKAQAERLLRVPPDGHPDWLWEQGFFATEFADARTKALSSQRYFYPVFDGLPGGLFGYDWSLNPCEFASVHFGGPKPKPNDFEVGALLHDILGRRRAVV